MRQTEDESGFMYMTLDISKPTAFCKYSLAILSGLISRRGHYSVQSKKEKKEKAHDSWSQGLHLKQPCLRRLKHIKHRASYLLFWQITFYIKGLGLLDLTGRAF